MRSSHFMGQYMLFISIALTIGEYYDFREMFRSSYDLKDYLKSLERTPDVPALVTEARDSFNYGNQPLMKVQDRRKHNHHARKSQAGLEMRIKTKIAKAEKALDERLIEKAFARKLKSHRWLKRHPGYYINHPI